MRVPRAGPCRQQPALLLACLRRDRRFPRRDDRRHRCVQSRTRASPLRGHAPRLCAHPRFLASHGPAFDSDIRRRVEGLARLVRGLALGNASRGSSGAPSKELSRRSSRTGSSPPAKSAGWSPWAHRAVLFSVLGLAAISGVVALLLAAGRAYPLSMGNPLKVLSNVFAALLIGGAGYFLVSRVVEAARGNRSTFFDWAFLVNVLLAGVTGVATEALRVAGRTSLGLSGVLRPPGGRLDIGHDSSLHEAGPRRLPRAGGRREGVRRSPRRRGRARRAGCSWLAGQG